MATYTALTDYETSTYTLTGTFGDGGAPDDSPSQPSVFFSNLDSDFFYFIEVLSFSAQSNLPIGQFRIFSTTPGVNVTLAEVLNTTSATYVPNRVVSLGSAWSGGAASFNYTYRVGGAVPGAVSVSFKLHAVRRNTNFRAY